MSTRILDNPERTPAANAFQAASDAIVGRRAEQQDAARVLNFTLPRGEPAVLLLVADGMGGHVGGAVAGDTAAQTFVDLFRAQDHQPMERRLRQALDGANQALAAAIEANPRLRGMGCTLTAAVLSGGRAQWVSVGDTLLLAIGPAGLRRLNQDHSMAVVLDAQAARGEISQREAEESPQRHVLRAALIGDEIALIDESQAELAPGELIVVASDGVLTLKSPQLAELAQRAALPQDFIDLTLAEITRRMPDDQDNTTIAAARIGDSVAAAPVKAPSPNLGIGWRTVVAVAALVVGVGVLGAAGLLYFHSTKPKPIAPVARSKPARPAEHKAAAAPAASTVAPPSGTSVEGGLGLPATGPKPKPKAKTPPRPAEKAQKKSTQPDAKPAESKTDEATPKDMNSLLRKSTTTVEDSAATP